MLWAEDSVQESLLLFESLLNSVELAIDSIMQANVLPCLFQLMQLFDLIKDLFLLILRVLLGFH